ncbi:MAG: hypothetical protein JSV36_09840 [Anaerolineae bacterium]|nr:MAG: hypothetical protein JSV36_09840 [Anaerolineae bacterium]
MDIQTNHPSSGSSSSSGMMDVEAERGTLLGQIEAHVDVEYRAGMGMAVPTGLKMYGVRVPQLRGIARDWQRTH